MITTSIRNAVVTASVGLAAVTSARADFNFRPVGLAFDQGDWVQGFLLTSAEEFQNIGLVLTRQEGDDRSSGFARWDFETPPGQNKHGFVTTMLTSDLGTAEGEDAHQLTWDMHFTGDRETQRFVLTLFAYDDGATASAVQSTTLSWNGSGWTTRGLTGVTWEEFQAALGGEPPPPPPPPPVVPAPPALALGVLGLALVGALTRWIR